MSDKDNDDPLTPAPVSSDSDNEKDTEKNDVLVAIDESGENKDTACELSLLQQIKNIWMYDQLVDHLRGLDNVESEVRYKLFTLTRKYLQETYPDDPLCTIFASCIFSAHINYKKMKNNAKLFMRMTQEQYKMFESYLDA
jgi:hypothetical protein